MGGGAGGAGAELVQLTTIAADAYGDTAVNTAMLRCCNPVSDLANNILYGAYHTQSPTRTTLFKVPLTSGALGTPVVDISGDATTANDQHNFFSLAVDGSSRLHLSGDMHGVPMQYTRLASGDINWTAWDAVPTTPGSTLESLVTYPTFSVQLPNGDLLRFFRDGGSGDGTLVMERFADASATWSTLHATLVDGEGAESFYPLQIRYNAATGKLHIGGCWRRTTDLFTNHDVIYFYLLESEDFANAYQADGSAQTLPVTRGNADNAASIAENTGLLNTGGTGWNESDDPILSYFRDPGDGFSQLHVSYWNGAAWVENPVPGDNRANPIPFSLVGVAGDWALSVFSSPSILVKAGRTIIVGTYTGLGSGIWAWVCEEPTLSEWQPHQIHATDVQEWACVADLPQWETNGELYALHQKAVRPAAAPIGAQTLSVLRWRPQVAPYTYVAPTAYWDPATVSGSIGYVAARVGGASVFGTVGSDQTKCNDLYDARDSSALFVQATNSDAASYDYDLFDHGALGTGEHRAGVLFTAANSDFMLATDATTLTALTGVNVPLILCMVIQLTTAAVAGGQRFGSIGTSTDTTRYIEWGTDASGNPLFGRRVAGAAVVQYVGSVGALANAGKYVITCVFDGTNGYMRVNGVQQGAAVNMAFAGTLTPTHLSMGCRRRAGNELFSGFSKGAMFIGTTIPSTPNIAAMENALAAEYGITF